MAYNTAGSDDQEKNSDNWREGLPSSTQGNYEGHFDNATEQIVFEYDEADEASQKTLDRLSDFLRENPPPPSVDSKHKNKAVQRALGVLSGEEREIEYQIALDEGEISPGYAAVLQMLEDLTTALNEQSKFDNMDPNHVFLFVRDYFVEKKTEADLALLDGSVDEDELEAYELVSEWIEIFEQKLKEKEKFILEGNLN